MPKPTYFKKDYKSAVGATKNGMVVDINKSITERLEVDHSLKLGVRINFMKKLQRGNPTKNFDHDKKTYGGS